VEVIRTLDSQHIFSHHSHIAIMTDSFSESIGNGLSLVSSRTASHEFNFSSLVDSKYDGAKINLTRNNAKRETPPTSLLLPQLSESKLPGFNSSPLCDVFDASHENHTSASIERTHPPRQSVSSHNAQSKQCGISLLKNDNFSLSYSFRSQDTESNKSPIRDKIPGKKETNYYRDDFDRAAEIYDDSPASKSKHGAFSAVDGPSLTNTASIFRQRNEAIDARSENSYGDRREKSKKLCAVPVGKSIANERGPNLYDERKCLSINYGGVPTNSSFEAMPQSQNHQVHSKRPTRTTIEQRMSTSPSPGTQFSRGRSTTTGQENPPSPSFLNSSFDACLSDTDKFLGSLPLEETFDSFGNDVKNKDTPNVNNLSRQHYKVEGRENGINSLVRHHHPRALVDGTAVNTASSCPRESRRHGSNRALQRGGTDSRKKTNYKSDAMTKPSPEVSHRSDALGFYAGIRAYTEAFSDFSFLLPGLKNSTGYGSRNNHQFDLSPRDVFIAKRRLASAVCAFGGLVGQKPKPLRNSSISSIFRTKCEDTGDHSVSKKSRSRARYEQKLPLRYYENEDRLSWEIEEHPPLELVTDDEDGDVAEVTSKTDTSSIASPLREKAADGHDNLEIGKSSSYDISGAIKLKDESKEESTNASANSSVSTNSGETPKMKYRCKLCGQPKQNHTCPYQQSLQRSIGTMSYPALNAFDANEPGEVAPPLSEMNNFVPGEDEQLQMQTPPRPKAYDSSGSPNYDDNGPNTVTPETQHSRSHTSSTSPHNSQKSSRSASSSGSPSSSQSESEGNKGNNYTRAVNGKRRRTAVYSTQQKSRSKDTSDDQLFLETMEIKPEQFRVVTPSKDDSEEGTYQYPALPLTYGQRKKMSDSLFSLSKEVKGLTDECADVLRDARETDSWDLAVSELTTQIIVVLHCPKGDFRLKGLQQYLMTLGISC